ncbi:hypothetical protein QZH41_020321 [Actinostola sp. cb2023]|nr:hypothetical protein QZH41_020321 [Actinostola sp. cb2023]
MASSAVDLCQIVTENGVNSLLNTLLYGERKFLVWTRLCLENSSWIINTSDGISVWRLEMDREHIDSYIVLAQVDTCEAFLTKIRSDFHCGNLMISPEASKVSLMVGAAESILRLDLYEANCDERKSELQHLILWMADNITTLTDKLKATTESLERQKSQKESNPSGSTIFDLPPKKIQVPTVKRKPGYSLVNPGSRNDNLPTDLVPAADNLEATVHLSVLAGSQMLDVYRCPDPSRCLFPCTKSNRRYHCPLCDNKPQKPGRMRRHFFTMHAGKHVIEHEGYRILRCKLKCSRANGRITDCSHYHCCLCGRVCLRKVHLCCHLQAHALGTAKDVEDELMDASKTEEEQDDEEQEDDEEGEDDTADDTVLQTSQLACSIADSGQTENMVTLADGTQVVYVQSMENGETLTVVPVSSQADTIQIPTADQLNPSLQVLTSSQATNQIQELGGISQHGDGQDLEAILNQEESRVVGCSESPVSTNTTTGMTSFHTYTSQTHEPPRQLAFGQHYSELSNDQPNPAQGGVVVFEGAPSSTADQAMQKAQDLPGVPCGLGTQDPMGVGVGVELSGVNNSLDINDLVSTTPVAVSQVGSIVASQSIPTHTMPTPMRNESLMTSDSTSQFQTPSFPDGDPSLRNYKTPDHDSLQLLKIGQASQGDDTVFNKLFSDVKPRVESIFQHASVVPEQTSFEVSRCKNTECDCRLYHCPLCMCLPNKPGRIREHFRKIHSENLIIRYQGYQMLRCKLGCCRSTGKRILNSHYHCCLCGCICISKSGVYEHMRTQHTDSLKTDSPSHSTEKRKTTSTYTAPRAKKRALDDSPSPSKLKVDEAVQIQRPYVVQIPSLSGNRQGVEQAGGMVSGHDVQSSSNQQQQPVVIVMPQQLQNYAQGQNQQPIVIVMPQGSGGISRPFRLKLRELRRFKKKIPTSRFLCFANERVTCKFYCDFYCKFYCDFLNCKFYCKFCCDFWCKFYCKFYCDFWCKFYCDFWCKFYCDFWCKFYCDFWCKFYCDFWCKFYCDFWCKFYCDFWCKFYCDFWCKFYCDFYCKFYCDFWCYRILRCKLKCSRANGRITDCSHYHCCLCGRVCLRKVHLCCHLQAHALGTAKDVEDEMMDASKTEEEQDDEEQEDDEEGEDDTADDTVLQTSQLACSIADSGQTENMVTLADGTQVVYVQSMENGETLTVVPVSSQADTIQIPTADQLNPSLQVITSSQATNQIQELGGISQHGDGQDLEAILNQGRCLTEESGVVGCSVSPVSTNTTTGMTSFHTYTSQTHEPPRQLAFGQHYSELSNDQPNPAQGGVVVFEGAPSSTADQAMQKAQDLPGVPCGLGTQDPMGVGVELSGVNNSLDINDLVSTTPVAASQVGSIVASQSIPTHTMPTPMRNESLMTSDSTSQFQTPSFPDGDPSLRNYKTPDHDSLQLLKIGQASQGDDTVFNKLFSDVKPRVESIFQHASVVPEQTSFEVSRCKNTECDCRLYHCPLCMCLPNKPGRIREHFRKIHSENLIIRYQGYQMLRCKLGCCRSTGKRILNSHYHCCLCGCICISKSGVYEHMRTQHTADSLKTDSPSHSTEKRKTTSTYTAPRAKKRALDDSPSPSKLKVDEAVQIQRPYVVQIPSLSGNRQGVEQAGGMVSGHDVQSSSNQQQQPVVIVMPQQLQNYTQGQNQQPIVIVMPQGSGGGGVQMAQPYVVPMPQAVNN